MAISRRPSVQRRGRTGSSGTMFSRKFSDVINPRSSVLKHSGRGSMEAYSSSDLMVRLVDKLACGTFFIDSVVVQ